MSLKVFLVEDDEIYAEFIKRKLRRKYKIYSFTTAEDCLVTFKSIKPDVILLDYYLPGMNGMEMYEQIKDQLNDNIKLIILSGIEDGNLVMELIKKGVRDYVVKDEKVIDSLMAIIDGKEDTLYGF
jgi:DNA-binding response OmpR family regulator